jgi:hypothetical protein
MAGICGLDAFNTNTMTFREIPHYLGILFSVSPEHSPWKLTLQLDLRLEDDSDTSIEVYTYDGVFGRVFISDASKWKQVANEVVQSSRWSRCPYSSNRF